MFDRKQLQTIRAWPLEAEASRLLKAAGETPSQYSPSLIDLLLWAVDQPVQGAGEAKEMADLVTQVAARSLRRAYLLATEVDDPETEVPPEMQVDGSPTQIAEAMVAMLLDGPMLTLRAEMLRSD